MSTLIFLPFSLDSTSIASLEIPGGNLGVMKKLATKTSEPNTSLKDSTI